MTEQALQSLLSQITPLDGNAMDAAKKRQAQLAKPPGSLGQLEQISIRLAGITGNVHNSMEKRRICVLAADNGVVDEGVSSTPQSVTLSQSINMTLHKTGMSCLAQFFGDEVMVTDVGIAVDCPVTAVRNRKVRYSTANLYLEPAMTREDVLQAMEAGFELADLAKQDGIEAVGVGEMGIGNTTTSSAVLCALTGLPVELLTGRGGGLTDRAFDKKKHVISHALQLHQPKQDDVLDILSKVGGLDICAMTGVFLGCAKNRIPVVVDGFISIVAALCAARLCPTAKDYFFLSHVSEEPGYKAAQQALNLPAYLNLQMRLGEGSGCPIAFQVLRAACAVMNTMATFEEASINDDYLEELRAMEKNK